MEYQSFDFELKAEADAEGRFTGYGSVFNNMDQGRDVIDGKAFDSTLERIKSSGKMPKMLWQHDPSQPIGVWDKIEKDERGLKVSGRVLSSLQKGAEVLTMLKESVLDGLSIGYQTKDFEIKKDDGGGRFRLLKDLDLWEVSVVTFPMNTEATVTDVKNLQSAGEVARILRQAGVPGKFADLVSQKGYDAAMATLEDGHRGDDQEAKRQLDELFNAMKKLKETINA